MYSATRPRACLAIALGLICLSVHSAEPKPAQSLITISKETTYITSPLRPDGYVDYIAALDEASRQGVTAENNASVLLWKAMGPAGIDEQQRALYFKKLGMPPLPEKGDYFVPFDKFVKQSVVNPERPEGDDAAPSAEDIIYDQLEQLERRGGSSWTEKEFPLVAAWLKANEAPLVLVIDAARRPRRYDPYIPGEDEIMIGVLMPSVMQYREAAAALRTRATLRVGQKKWDGAWQDLLACHRLARLAAQEPTLIEGYVGCAIDATACEADRVFLQHVPPDQKRLATLRTDLAALPPMPSLAGKIATAERLMCLDAVAMIARDGASKIQEYSAIRLAAPIAAMLDSLGRIRIDWDEMLRTGNSCYDRIADALAQPTPGERKAAFAKIQRDLRKLQPRSRDWKGLLARSLLDSRKARSQAAANVLLALLVPALELAIDSEARQIMQFSLIQLAVELAAYRADHGSYPAHLEDLTPKYVAKLPVDVFSGEALHYEGDGERYLLYSIGPNEKDDRGQGYEDKADAATSDDIAIRMGAAPKQPKENKASKQSQ